MKSLQRNNHRQLPYFLTLGAIALLFSAIAFVVISAHAQTVPNSPQAGQNLVQNLASTQAQFPYKKVGLGEREAAAYLLDRFTFGARPNDVETLLQQGLETWFNEQLQARSPETAVNERLAPLTTLAMSNDEILRTFPNVGMLLRQAVQEGVMSEGERGEMNQAEYRQKLRKYAESKGYRPKRQLYGEMYAQKLLRAVYSLNQLREVMTDFWFNHFNVSITDNQADQYVMTYERDAIRPNALGNFRALLGATTKHPAMLTYLDNAQSTAPEGTPTTLSLRLDTMRNQAGAVKKFALDAAQRRGKLLRDSALQQVPEQFRPQRGINENYARELMELHTLGVDGGYTQRDVTEAARILTGWTVYPKGAMVREERAKKLEQWLERGKNLGFVQEGDFLFRADAHDATEKTCLGVKFPAGGGMNEGEQLLDMLAANTSTAKFICTKLARRFVSDAPPESLVQRMSAAFLASNGNIPDVLLTMVSSEEFWKSEGKDEIKKDEGKEMQNKNVKKEAVARTGKGKKSSVQAADKVADIPPTAQARGTRTKIKSPFELAVSALRALNADVKRPREVLEWVRKIGQPLYAYQAPTGFPDRAEAWINTGSLLNRMNFGLNLALGNIGGVSFDLATLNNNREPQSLADALETYFALLLPERNNTETVRLLMPVLADPNFAQKLDEAASKETTPNDVSQQQANTRPSGKQSQKQGMKAQSAPVLEWEQDDEANKQPKAQKQSVVQAGTIAQVVGIILGSPEFQRR